MSNNLKFDLLNLAKNELSIPLAFYIALLVRLVLTFKINKVHTSYILNFPSNTPCKF